LIRRILSEPRRRPHHGAGRFRWNWARTRFHCPLLPVRVERLQGARFRLTVLPPLDVVDIGDAAADVLSTMTRVNAVIEGWVRARPEQWLWLHRRWPD
jgi:Kdo2-lipid IVA lauroyltransferase/acyltransferase